MLSTEVNRIILLVALGITGYLLILQWNEDYMQTPVAEDYAPRPAPQVDSSATAPDIGEVSGGSLLQAAGSGDRAAAAQGTAG